VVRHDLLAGAISSAPRGVPEAAAPAALIAALGLPAPHPPGVEAAASGAVDLAPVATTANQDLPAAQGAQKEAAAAAVVEIATAPEATFNPVGCVRRHYAPAIVLRHGVGRGAEVTAKFRRRRAPGPMIDSD
jgi:hypothetical protein